ncbi:MAG: cytoplasmic protein [Acidobacteriota bacterium]
MPEIDLEKAQREEIRWRLLRALDAGRPLPVLESLLLRICQDVDLPATPSQVRRELAYLEIRGLVRIHGKLGPTWRAELTRDGVDVVEYAVACESGIARPPRDW